MSDTSLQRPLFLFIDDPAGVEWLVYFWTYERLNLENERKEMNQLKLPTD